MKTVQVVDNVIIGFGDLVRIADKDGNEKEIINIEVSDELFQAIIDDRNSYDFNSETDFVPKYIYSNGEIIIDPDYETKKAQKEAERVGELTMTALDFITFLRQCGISLESIRIYLENNIELDTQLKYCQNVYCKVARAVMPIEVDGITITSEMVENAFKLKNGELNQKSQN